MMTEINLKKEDWIFLKDVEIDGKSYFREYYKLTGDEFDDAPSLHLRIYSKGDCMIIFTEHGIDYGSLHWNKEYYIGPKMDIDKCLDWIKNNFLV